MLVSYAPGFVLIMAPLTFKRATDGVNFEGIGIALEYITNEDSFEKYLLEFTTFLNQNSHFIITFGVMWIVVVFFLFNKKESKGRENNERKTKKNKL